MNEGNDETRRSADGMGSPCHLNCNAPPHPTVPRDGMFAIVRNRRGVITAVEPSDDARHGRLHLVHVEYKDDQLPVEERLLWELEPHGRLLELNVLPNASGDPMPPDDFDALVRAARWTSASPFTDPDGSGQFERLPISSPFHGAVQVEDLQLVPLLKALAMLHVNLLIADVVGLGKTIEAGLIFSELFLRRRIQRALVWSRYADDRFPQIGDRRALYATDARLARRGQ